MIDDHYNNNNQKSNKLKMCSENKEWWGALMIFVTEINHQAAVWVNRWDRQVNELLLYYIEGRVGERNVTKFDQIQQHRPSN